VSAALRTRPCAIDYWPVDWSSKEEEEEEPEEEEGIEYGYPLCFDCGHLQYTIIRSESDR
jgi:hypothetical protein